MDDNLEHYCVCMFEDPEAPEVRKLPPEEQALLTTPKAAVLKSTMWPEDYLITCRFLGGSAALQGRVKSAAKQWESIANLTFDFRNAGPTAIRIAFLPGKGSWSYIGTVCKTIPEPRPTMNYGWLTDASSDAVVRQVVLHEFGHAVGLIHEHQNPLGGIKWNRDAVIADLSGPPNNWNLDKIETNMFKHYDPTALVASAVDKKSIMMYPIPRAWTLDGFSTGLNSSISAIDKLVVSKAYRP